MAEEVQRKAATACSDSSRQGEEYGRIFGNTEFAERAGGLTFVYRYNPVPAQCAMNNTRYAHVTHSQPLWNVFIYELRIDLAACRHNPVSARSIWPKPSSTAHQVDLKYTYTLNSLLFKFTFEIVIPNASVYCSRCLS